MMAAPATSGLVRPSIVATAPPGVDKFGSGTLIQNVINALITVARPLAKALAIPSKTPPAIDFVALPTA